MSKYPDIANRMHQLKRELQLDQVGISRLAGVTKQAVGKWFSGDSCPQRDALANLKQRAGINDEWVLNGAGPILLTQGVEEPHASYGNTPRLDEIALISVYRQLNKHQQQALLALIRTMQSS